MSITMITAIFIGLLQLMDTPIAPVTVWPMSRGEVNAICDAHAIKDPKGSYANGAAGCVVFSNETGLISWHDRYTADDCNVFIRNDMHFDFYLETLAHEFKHCEGWPPDHPKNWN